ncbi:MAG: DNA primase [Flavobacteriales bacterium]|nr:DNA primase [Flavobacteriales bacterium]MCC6576527.1 DNA primase [Flavobacteriales bacterium]NUQ14309.1 DNA primase [Flavobacteriales bacterium]
MIAPDAIQRVKDAVRVDEVVGEFVALKRKGPRYLGLCPFHNEKTPSFNVSPALGIFKCFGCGEAGDAITFLQKHEHLSYVEAIRWLAKRYNIDLPETEATPEQQLEHSERESLAAVQRFATEWSTAQLWDTDEGRRIGLAYFHERGFRDEVIRTFQLGYVPEQGAAFATAARAQGFDPELLEKAGWIKRREDGTAWDFFAGRVTFPVHGLGGQVIAFGARALRTDKGPAGGAKLPKYFNSPESALYVKSRSLYGIHFARKAIADSGICLLVEGYTDVISLHQAGIANVVASSGTSLTEDQVRLIKRYARQVTILYDGDPAGIKASLRGIDLILAEGLGVKVVLFPDGEDPDSFARSRPSSEVEAFLRDSAKDFLVFKTELLVKDTGGDPVLKAAAIHNIVESIARIPDQVLRQLYIQQCGRLMEVSEQALLSEMNKVLRRALRKQHGPLEAPEAEVPALQAPQPPPVAIKGTAAQERDLLRMLLNYGHQHIMVPVRTEGGETREEDYTVAEFLFELMALDDILFDEPLFKEIYLDYRHAKNLGVEVEAGRYAGHEQTDWRHLAIDLLTERHLLSPNWKERHRIHTVHERDILIDAIEEGVDILRERRLDRMLEALDERLRGTAVPDEQMAILREKMDLINAKLALSRKTGRVVVG